MNQTKWTSLVLSLLLGFSLLSSQSLVELAQKEKARRDKLKGKAGKVLTNADLQVSEAKAALIAPEVELLPTDPLTDLDAEDATLSEESAASDAATAESDLSLPQEAPTLEELEERWQKSFDYVDLLTLKMNALWNDYYSMNDMTSRESIQLQIVDINGKLEQARNEEIQARQTLEEARLRRPPIKKP